MDINKVLARLCDTSYITGKGKAAQVALEEIRKFSPQARPDRLGSIIAPIVPTRDGGEHLMIEAHLDEIGFVVTSIDEDGFLRIGKAGGPDLRILLGHEVTVFGREELFGVFCCRPPHLTSREDYKKSPDPDELAIDIGYTHDQAAEHVSPGDFVTLRRSLRALPGGYLTGKALDNRAGVVTVLRALELLDGKVPEIGLTVLFSTSEELGERGATAATFAISPTQAIVIDVSHGYTPDAAREKCGEMGKGPMIGVSPILSGDVTAKLFSLAKERDIPYQTEVMGSGTGTDSDVVSVSREGVRTGLVSIPLRYMHTAAETVSPADIENSARLISAYILANGVKSDV